MPKKIVIVGAAGYVGIELVSQLQDLAEYDLFAFTRDNGSFLLEGKKINILNEENIAANGPFETVINLAYPTVSQPTLFPSVNESILNTMKKLISKETNIIHVSTQAVFGFGMDREVVADFIKERRDFPYVEAKLSMEHMVKKEFPSNNLSIVRLGNVWGPGAGVWTGAVADKLLFGQFVAVEGEDGYANITDVKNVASYLTYLTSNVPKGTHIYHLAEFSHLKWSDLIGMMAKELHVEPVYAQIKPYYSLKIGTELSKIFKIPSIGDTYRELIWERFVGSFLRSMVRLMGTKRYQNMQKNETKSLPQTQTLTKTELTHLIVVSSPIEFKTVTEKGWTPLINFDESWQLVKSWMADVGYINE